MPFEVIPAIDLRGGHCVRLFQGDYARETVYSDDPAAMARHWRDLGATRLHVVDLDGARGGEQVNAEAVRAILAAIDIPVELGGGVRDLDTVSRWLDAGVERVYLGTAAITDPALVAEACARYPGRVAAAADARDGRIAVHGWEQDSGQTVIDFARRVVADGVVAISYTNVALDGTFEGPDIIGVQALIEALTDISAQVILAGGVGSVADVRRAAAVPGLAGVIIGRALYEGRVDLTEALTVQRQT
ncbi:MAG: 1-(5-phosphoribosyl)-5-[(5-phosphoribosylamino)methylideneamino]imidazole-4-carboxamide isomerase [Dehalococcoidia bacterium]|nr:1-(5-phosphoribosyl)-5-[(5-phosphoribosylamino)methylideneamino]imidazole-4-carboxamide isomerase [Dehalococcoidia bacterium]